MQNPYWEIDGIVGSEKRVARNKAFLVDYESPDTIGLDEQHTEFA